MSRRSEALRVAQDPYRETPAKRGQVEPRECSYCRHCRFCNHMDWCVNPELVTAARMAGIGYWNQARASSLDSEDVQELSRAAQGGDCSHYRPSARTRLLRLFGLRRPVVR